MSRAVGPFPLAVGATVNVPIPEAYPAAQVTLVNDSPYPSQVTTGVVESAWLPAWSQITFDLGNTRQPVQVTPSAGAFTSAAAQLLVTFLDPDETPPVDSIGASPLVAVTGVTPTGAITMFGGVAPPNGWLLCNGTAVSRTTFADLFMTIGTTYGPGDGSTTFNVPDLRGRAPIAPDAGAGRVTANNLLGQSAGEQTHQLLDAELASHSHGINDPGHGHGVTDPQHQHQYTQSTPAGSAISGRVSTVNTQGTTSQNGTTASATGVSVNAAGTGITTAADGGNSPHNNLQPYLVVAFIIKT